MDDSASQRSCRMQDIRTMLQGLTVDDLKEWGGTKIYNRGRDYIGAVDELSSLEDGTLVARVSGTDEYVTSVKHDGNGEFSYTCTCPYVDGPCKHAVAVVLAAAAQLKKHKEIPILDPAADLYLELFDDGGNDEGGLEDDDEEEFAKDDPEPAGRGSLPKGRSPQVEKLLAGKSHEELLGLLSEVATEYPEVGRRLREAVQLQNGQVEPLVRSLRKEIRRVTAEEAWYNPWRHEGNLPDYSRVEKQLRTLLTNGHADAVLELGEELFRRGNAQIEQSNDEGATAEAIASCLEVVLQAVPHTTIAPPKQLLWVIDRCLDDQFGLLDRADGVFKNSRYVECHWREVADVLEERLRALPAPRSGRFSENYRRDSLVAWLLDARRRGGQPERVIPLLEKEAAAGRSFELLVDALLAAGERERARRWCITGHARTIAESPGIAAGLKDRLCRIAVEEKNFPLAAAYHADDFFERPSEQGYKELRRSAEKIKVWPVVRERTLAWLRDGRRPGGAETPWPLPEPEVKRPQPRDPRPRESFPKLEMLIEIAILEKSNDDVVALYRELDATKRWGRQEIDQQVARAVAESHPEVALGVWKKLVDGLIAEVKPRAYEEAVKYLKLMRSVYTKGGRLPEWQGLLVSLRNQHKAKRRLMQELDGLVKEKSEVKLL
ncbi:MAG: SWIM zinc finger domain-containing protein [Candidatus Zixiibacteriota bacterium]|nr:MAG: SWIM zinc finger domain-containing protein [candidate division Zixibacteria bacterium]